MAVAAAAVVIVKIDKTIWPRIEDWMCVSVCVCASLFWYSIVILSPTQRKTCAWFPWDRNKPLLHYIYTLIVLKIWRKYNLLDEYSWYQHGYLKSKLLSHYSVTWHILRTRQLSLSIVHFVAFRFQYAEAQAKAKKKDEEVPISSRISITSHIEYALTQCSIRWY